MFDAAAMATAEYITRIRPTLIVGGYVRRRPRRSAASQRTALTRPPPAHRAPSVRSLTAAETSSCEIGSRAPRHLTFASTILHRSLITHTYSSNAPAHGQQQEATRATISWCCKRRQMKRAFCRLK